MTYERFLEYIKYPTQSDEECANCPSTGGQLVFAEYLVKELESVGAEQVKMDEHGYVWMNMAMYMLHCLPQRG